MKLVRFGNRGAERPGVVDQDGEVRDLSGIAGDIDASPGVGLGRKPARFNSALARC